MGKDIKSDLKNLAKETEVKITESILRWKFKKVDGKTPDKKQLEYESRFITDQANKILAKRGKNVLEGLKKAYRESKRRGDSSD
jgi:hypothetical protein